MHSEDNSNKEFTDADSFYQSLDKKEYAEFKNAKMNFREKILFEKVNDVIARTDQYGEVTISDRGSHPKRQVYLFVTVSQEGKKKIAVFDAETGDKMMEHYDH